MAIKNENLKKIKELNYIPVGLKNDDFSNEWLRDNTGDNISKKNPFYGEYTFYYWYWKNLLRLKKKEEWVGFCSYREYWRLKKKTISDEINQSVLKDCDPEWLNYDAIIGEPMSVKDTKTIKIFKYGKLASIRNPKAIFSKKGRTIRWNLTCFTEMEILIKLLNFFQIKTEMILNILLDLKLVLQEATCLFQTHQK